MAVEPTTRCNLKCPQCPSGLRAFSRPTGDLYMDVYERLIYELQDSVMYLTLYFQGEPFLNPNFFKHVALAKKLNIFTSTSTNGHYLTDKYVHALLDSGLDRIIISVDGMEQETYEGYRVGGNLDKVIKGIKNLLRLRKERKVSHPWIILQWIAFKHNEFEAPKVRSWALELGVDEVFIKTAQVYEYEKDKQWIPQNEDLSRYTLGADGLYTLKGAEENSCWRMWSSFVATVDGQVVPCCFDKDASHSLGTLSEKNSFKDIWKGASYTSFREKLIQSRKGIDICQNCSEGTQVWA